ncbi:MAG: hypothetical protein JNM18_25740 [Planctomycetaceae bacterium]|nr:hypothetical protein [Planctomycetaceae bacterium]
MFTIYDPSHSPPPLDAAPLLPLAVANVSQSWLDALHQTGVPTATHVPGQNVGRFVLVDRRAGRLPEVSRDQVLIDVSQLGDEVLAAEQSLFEEGDTVRRAWRVGDLTVSERVASVDRRQLTRRLLAALRQVVEQRGGVWLAVSHVPWPYRTLFNLRADHDSYIPGDFATFLDTIAGHEHAVSHFVCAGGFVDQPAALAQLRGHDVGSHGFWHHTYHDMNSNLRNIRAGVDSLRRGGLEPTGFVAPHGRWHRGVQQALDTLSISHSGEFAFCTDDWPRYPTGSRVLQIPVHPICLGLAFEALQSRGVNDEAARVRAAELIAEHFSRWSCAQHAACEPICVYGHPDERLGRYPLVVRRLLATIDALPGVWSATQTEIARWWRVRQEIRFRVWREAGRLQFECDQLPRQDRVAVDVYSPRGVARIALAGRRQIVALDELQYDTRAEPARLESTTLDERATLPDQLRLWLDWEHVTPITEIDASTWRGWLKRSLRTIRDGQRRAA